MVKFLQFVFDFAISLLQLKFRFDKYIIKREFIAGTDKWALKRLKWYKKNKVSYVNTFGDEDNTISNRSTLMILAMFQIQLTQVTILKLLTPN